MPPHPPHAVYGTEGQSEVRILSGALGVDVREAAESREVQGKRGASADAQMASMCERVRLDAGSQAMSGSRLRRRPRDVARDFVRPAVAVACACKRVAGADPGEIAPLLNHGTVGDAGAISG